MTCPGRTGIPNNHYMRTFVSRFTTAMLLATLSLGFARPVQAQRFWPFNMREDHTLDIRDPSELSQVRTPSRPPPPTVATLPQEVPQQYLSLDEAIRIALRNSEVVRVLGGVGAVSSGRTIYDAAIAATDIAREQATFDPTVDVNNSFNRFESPVAIQDPGDPTRTLILGSRTDDYDMRFGLSKRTITGGTAQLNVSTNPSRFQPGTFLLNPRNSSSAELSFTQPLLEGGGIEPNLAPIVLARIDTERSYFALKDSVQELVRGVIDAYWGLVFARTDVWARQQQVDQGQFAYDFEQARKKVGFGAEGDVALARVALEGFKANLIASKANLLNREAALRNILFIPPSDPEQPVPVTPPATDRLKVDWQAIVSLAMERRPDIIELKLIIEADEQRLLQANNQSLPAVDAVMLYRWNGLDGTMPSGEAVSSRSGQFTDWTLGVNFSVPLGLRQGRAALRRQELVIARDRANLQQGLHSALHVLAANTRNLDQFYEQYLAFQQTRTAARTNLNVQRALQRTGRTIFLNVLQAITSWGNAVSSEAQALAQYNTELANLERQTGTILETHGVYFFEERFCSIAPLGRLARDQAYPESIRPLPNVDRYPSTDRPAEESFNLETPTFRRGTPRRDPQPTR